MSPLIVMLLVSLGPIMVGVLDLGSDDTETDEENTPADDPADPMETVDVASFLDNARFGVDNPDDLERSRGTDDDALYEAPDDRGAIHDASGGNDTLVGGAQADTLAGGDGSDRIEGGDGDDALFGAFIRQTREDDFDADTLFGGAGDDILVLGDGDMAEGGAGMDIFTGVVDATQEITISDFDPAEDALAIETEDPDAASVTEQTVEEGGLRVSLSTGLSIRLEGLDAPLADGTIQFIRAAEALPA